MKAIINSSLRPAKTSKLNPFAMRPTPYGEIRVSPRISAMASAGVKGPLTQIAENKAGYATSKVEARMTAADMVRRYRQTKTFSAKLAMLNARVTEFAVTKNPNEERADAVRAADRRLTRTSYTTRGKVLGTVAGAYGGAMIAKGLSRGATGITDKQFRNRALLGGVLGGIYGYGTGAGIGGMIRRK